MLKTSADIKALLITTFTGFEGIGSVVCEDYTKVMDRQNTKIVYPLMWIMYPFTKRPIYENGPKYKWQLEALFVNTAAQDDYVKQEANFTAMERLGEKVIHKLEELAQSTRDFEFDQNKDVGEWSPKYQYSPDNDNGYLIPLSIKTFRCTGDPDCPDC